MPQCWFPPQFNPKDRMPMLERRYLHLDGLRLSYLEKGMATEGTQTFVLLHGLMGSAETFQPLLDEMPRDSHIIALDMPGSGLSERRDDLAASMPATAAFIEKFLNALDLKKPCLIGHSHGGAVALRLARTSPSRVQSLVGPAWAGSSVLRGSQPNHSVLSIASRQDLCLHDALVPRVVPDDGPASHGRTAELGHPGAPQALSGQPSHPWHHVASAAPSEHLAGGHGGPASSAAQAGQATHPHSLGGL